MKKIQLAVFLLLLIQNIFAQNSTIDQTVQAIEAEKDVAKKIDRIVDVYTTEFNNDPKLVIQTGLKLLDLSLKNSDNIGESAAYSMLGHGYRLSGNNIKGLDFHHKAIAIAEKTGNQDLLAMAENQLAHIYKDREENEKAIDLYLSSLKHSQNGKNEKIKGWPLLNLGAVYLSVNKLDSSLMYSQQAYESSIRLNDNTALGYILTSLGGVQSKLGNKQLAETYYHMAIKELSGSTLVRHLSLAYAGLAEHFYDNGQIDSCIYYAKKAISILNNTVFSYMNNRPAKLLMQIYEHNNCDSTLKYAKIYKAANDSFYNKKVNQQIQLMTFDEDLRQQQLAAEKIKAENERKINLQYAAILVAIFFFFILFALLSRSVIASEKFITFMGILGLLMIFEFINLLVHPFLEKVTHHSPVLMLLALMAIAALLIPLHHKLEKLIKERMAVKYKERRLSAAKKAIEKLENDGNNFN